jgi:hypothetical protein
MHPKIYSLGATMLLTFATMATAEDVKPDTTTNTTGFKYTTVHYKFEDQLSTDLIKRFSQEMANKETMAQFNDTFGPQSRFTWNRRKDRLGYGIYDSYNNSGYKLFGDIALDSMRRSAQAHFPIDYWEWQAGNTLHGIGEFAVRFIGGTIGNPAEEHINPVSAQFSEIEENWQEKSAKRFEFGARFWSTYFYGKLPLGYYAGRPLVNLEARAYYNPLSPHFTLQASVPLVHQFRFIVGGRFDPIPFTKGDREWFTSACRLESPSFFGTRVAIGGSANRNEQLVLATLTKWF